MTWVGRGSENEGFFLSLFGFSALPWRNSRSRLSTRALLCRTTCARQYSTKNCKYKNQHFPWFLKDDYRTKVMLAKASIMERTWRTWNVWHDQIFKLKSRLLWRIKLRHNTNCRFSQLGNRETDFSWKAYVLFVKHRIPVILFLRSTLPPLSSQDLYMSPYLLSPPLKSYVTTWIGLNELSDLQLLDWREKLKNDKHRGQIQPKLAIVENIATLNRSAIARENPNPPLRYRA